MRMLFSFFMPKFNHREVMHLYDADLRERLLSKSEIQKLDMVTQAMLLASIEEVLEERNYANEQSVSTNAYDE